MPTRPPLPTRSTPRHSNGLVAIRPIAVGLARVFSMTLSMAYAAPLNPLGHTGAEQPEPEGASSWVLYVASLALVLSGGAFAGLTIA